MSKLISSKIDNWLTIAQQAIYPYTCFTCNQAGHNKLDLCLSCTQDLQVVNSTCRICDIETTLNDSLCGRCLKTTPHFDKVITLYRYEGIARFLIQSLKFQKKHCCAQIMGTLMAQHISALNTKPDALIAVPLHSTRLK